MPNGTAVSADARRQNASIVFQFLQDNAPCSRKDIRAATGLVSGTVTAIVAELIARGLVRESGDVVRTGGRPQRLLEVVPERVVGAVVYINVREVTVGLVTWAGEELWRGSQSHRGAAGDFQSIIGAVATLLDEAYEQASSTPRAWYSGAVIGVRGLVTGGDTILVTLEMPIRNLPLADAVSAQLRHPQGIRLLNAGRTAALAEWAAIPAEERPRMMAYVDVDARGVSGGLIEDGRLVGGEHGLAGEIGHIVVEAGGAPCQCGARGCLETVLRPDAMLRHAGLPPEVIEGLGDDGVPWLLERLEAGDQEVRAAIERAAAGVTAAVATLSNLVDVGLVVLGGGVGLLGPWLLPEVNRMLADRERVNPVFNPRVIVGGGVGHAFQAGLQQALRESVLADPLAVGTLE